MAVYEKWQSEKYIIGCDVWEARCPNCHELVESADPISSNYRFCPYCGFDMKSDFQRVADRRQFVECSMKLKKAKRLLKAAVEDFAFVSENFINNMDSFCSMYNHISGCAKGCPMSGSDDYGRCKWRYTDEALKLIGEESEQNE